MGSLARLLVAWTIVAPAVTRAQAADTEAQASRTLAVRLFVAGDSAAALAVWNRVYEPRIRSIDVRGAARSAPDTTIDRLGLAPHQLLTVSAFRRAGHRLAELPIARDTWLHYEPLTDGTAAIHAAIEERPVLPHGWVKWAVLGGKALILDEFRLPIGDAARIGEMWTIGLRWVDERPRASLQFETPAPGRLPGVLRVDASWQRNSFLVNTPAAGTTIVREERQQAGVTLGDWATGRLRWSAGTALDRIAGVPHLAFSGGVDTRWLDERVAMGASTTAWAGTFAAPGFERARADLSLRQRPDPVSPGGFVFSGAEVVSRQAPLTVWPQAGVGHGGDVWLRAHRLLTEGVVTGPGFGRQLVFTTVGAEQRVATLRAGAVSAAGFLDIARAWQGVRPGGTPLRMDAGLGVRWHGSPDGTVRLDIAHGLLDRTIVLSLSYVREWPRR